MRSSLLLFVCLLLLLSIESTESRIVQAETPVNQTCLNFGHEHDCRFYSCFEERFPCGPSYWIMKWGNKYCLRMQKSLANFDKTGQELLDQISKCLTNKLIKQRYYTLNSINCEQLRIAGQRIVHECHMNHAKLFCDAFHGKNRDCFIQLMDNEDQHDFTVIKTLASLGQKCTPKKRLADMRPRGKSNQCPPSSTSWAVTARNRN